MSTLPHAAGSAASRAPALHFETPCQAGMHRFKALAALVAALVLCWAGARAALADSVPGVGLGIAGASLFGLAALLEYRRAAAGRPPLVLDDEGLTVDDGLGEAWRLGWERIARVGVERVTGRRRVVLVLTGEPPRLVSLPAICHGDAPPEWLAGMIETFRVRAASPASPAADDSGPPRHP
ncbi:MAG: hypothetical protein Q9Q40_01705 [Acidobacteriota bacterium]|nr:hypothetical protein [Acidobacteriota bacterium]MDQ7087107.1 hypothetical protein [Acidobacteriota bacterium]